MRDPKMYKATYEMAHRRVANLSIDTDNFHGPSALMSPPESANSARRSSYDMNFQQTPISTYHPNTPVHHYTSQDLYNVGQTEKLKLNFQYPPSPVDFSSGQQSYDATTCNSPTWNSSMAFEQKSSMENSFYQESSTLLSTDQDWNSSTMSHYSNVDYAPDPSSLYMLPTQDPTNSFMTDVDASHHTHESLPSFIAPNQAVYQPEMDHHSMGLSGWGLQTPVHDQNILQSSSPAEYSPLTPSNLEGSLDSPYVTHGVSPSSSLYCNTSRSSLSKKGRKLSKADKRRSICKNVIDTESNTSITLLTDEKSESFRKTKIRPQSKTHKCNFCEQRFMRSEHCKRHEQSHSDEHPFVCYIADHRHDPNDPKSQCQVGKNNDGAQNRRDNSRSHHWTHLKAWLVSHDPIVRENNRALNKRNKGRNYPLSSMTYLQLIRDRDTPAAQDVVLRFLNQEAGKEFQVHILWEQEGCPVVACRGGAGQPGGCTMCRSGKAGGKNK